MILPLTVLRRLDGVLAPTKAAVLAEHSRTQDLPPEMADMVLNQKSGLTFYNHSPFVLRAPAQRPQPRDG